MAAIQQIVDLPSLHLVDNKLSSRVIQIIDTVYPIIDNNIFGIWILSEDFGVRNALFYKLGDFAAVRVLSTSRSGLRVVCS